VRRPDGHVKRRAGGVWLRTGGVKFRGHRIQPGGGGTPLRGGDARRSGLCIGPAEWVLAVVALCLSAATVAQAPAGSESGTGTQPGQTNSPAGTPYERSPDDPAITIADPNAAPGAGSAAAELPEAPPPNATVIQPRAFGYVVGDLLTQRVLLSLNGREFVPAELPAPGRVSAWFERRAVRLEKDSSGRRWLNVDYQLMNSPQALRVVTLPAWKLKGASGERQAGERRSGEPSPGELRIAEWRISVSPLTPERAATESGLGSLQPDRAAPTIPIAPIQRRLTIGVAGLLLTALAWVGWLLWRNWRASSEQPFARALSEMRGVDGSAREAWHALHRAFDATAGRAIRNETLPELFQRAPHLLPLKARIEEFFHQSAARFFADAPVADGVSAQALCRELRQIEKRHER
jgi:mxaA protein